MPIKILNAPKLILDTLSKVQCLKICKRKKILSIWPYCHNTLNTYVLFNNKFYEIYTPILNRIENYMKE